MGDAGGQATDIGHLFDMGHLLIKGCLFPVGPPDPFNNESADAAADQQKKDGGEHHGENDAIAVLVVPGHGIGDFCFDHQEPHVAVEPLADVEILVVGEEIGAGMMAQHFEFHLVQLVDLLQAWRLEFTIGVEDEGVTAGADLGAVQEGIEDA